MIDWFIKTCLCVIYAFYAILLLLVEFASRLYRCTVISPRLENMTPD